MGIIILGFIKIVIIRLALIITLRADTSFLFRGVPRVRGKCLNVRLHKTPGLGVVTIADRIQRSSYAIYEKTPSTHACTTIDFVLTKFLI